MNDPIIPFEDAHLLEAFRFGVETSLGAGTFAGRSLDARVERDLAGRAALRVAADLLGKRLDDVVVERVFSTPATWFDAFKEAWFPAWLLRRFPARRCEQRFELRVSRALVYPEARDVPDFGGRLGPVRMILTPRSPGARLVPPTPPTAPEAPPLRGDEPLRRCFLETSLERSRMRMSASSVAELRRGVAALGLDPDRIETLPYPYVALTDAEAIRAQDLGARLEPSEEFERRARNAAFRERQNQG